MVIDPRDGTSVFSKRLAPCVDEPMGDTTWEFAWHPNGEAIAVHRVEELFTGQNKGAIASNELVVWLPTGQEVVRESVDPASSLDLNTVAGRTSLWTRLGFPSAVDWSSDHLRFEQHDGVYQVLDANGQLEGVFALSTPSRRARPIAGHP
ncbi:MAG: hypothetical protein ACPG4T_22995, partial [Nannocystaceae bacterium]